MALDHFIYEAEFAQMGQVSFTAFSTQTFLTLIYLICLFLGACSQGCTLETREHQPGRPAQWTDIGFAQVPQGGTLEFLINNIPYSMEYDLVIRYESQVCIMTHVNLRTFLVVYSSAMNETLNGI